MKTFWREIFRRVAGFVPERREPPGQAYRWLTPRNSLASIGLSFFANGPGLELAQSRLASLSKGRVSCRRIAVSRRIGRTTFPSVKFLPAFSTYLKRQRRLTSPFFSETGARCSKDSRPFSEFSPISRGRAVC